MEETLEAGLARIFGTTSGQSEPQRRTPTETLPIGIGNENLLKQANQAYETALRAQRDGDWSRYGVEIKRLGEILKELRR